jgi:hypothetical protein
MEAMLKSMGKGSQNLKILVNPNYSNFIIVKKEENTDNLTTIVSFFQKTQNSICSKYGSSSQPNATSQIFSYARSRTV